MRSSSIVLTQGLLPIGLLPRDDGGIISSAAEGEKGK
jgi:hypothetical protein